MPPRHHRTVDRVVTILELIARSGRGMSLASLSQELDAPKSSIQVLTNGLVATGYLVEHEQKLMLGPGSFVLSLLGNRIAARALSHEVLVEIQTAVGYDLLVGVGLGDSVIHVDYAGPGPELQFFARNYFRRPLFATATGKIILSEMPTREMDSFVINAAAADREAAERFLAELPDIKRTGLAFNLGATTPGSYVVATPLRDRQGSFVAAVAAVTQADATAAPDMQQIGVRLQESIAAVTL